MRQGKEVYAGKYAQAAEMSARGMTPMQISEALGISYSCAYHWAMGLRKPSAGSLNEFISCLKASGPLPAAEISARFGKHNDLFLTASRRGFGIRRRVLGRKYAGYGTWYFLEGQEQELDSRIGELMRAVKSAKNRIRSAMNRHT